MRKALGHKKREDARGWVEQGAIAQALVEGGKRYEKNAAGIACYDAQGGATRRLRGRVPTKTAEQLRMAGLVAQAPAPLEAETQPRK